MEISDIDKEIVTAIHNKDFGKALLSWRNSEFCARTCELDANECDKTKNVAMCFQYLTDQMHQKSLKLGNDNLSFYIDILKDHLQQK